MKKLALLLVLTLAFSAAVLAQDTTQSTTSQTTTQTSPSTSQTTTTQTPPSSSQTTTSPSNSQTTTTGDQTNTTTTTTTTPTAPPKSTTTVDATSTSTLPQRSDEGSPYHHGEIGVFANYLRLADANDLNTIGVGADLDFNLNRHLQLEAQMAYNFERNVTTATSLGGFTSFNRIGLRSLTGLFGPKFITGTGAWRFFGTLQGGFINFNSSNKGVIGGLVGSVSSVTSGDTHGVFYPGIGVEAFAGPIGLRLDVGDEMYFNDGAHNNLRVAAGPQFRF